jgi:hypothetical protein
MVNKVLALSDSMEEELSEQLQRLRNAMVEAVLNSDRVAKAIAVLKESGREVQIAIDAVLVDGEYQDEDSASAQTDPQAVVFDPTDRIFLHTLKISGE